VYNVTRTFRVPVGHRLSNHLGLCKNIHGHNLKIQVSVKIKTLNEKSMVIDFSDLKDIVNKILAELDHSLLLNNSDHEYINAVRGLTKIVLINGEPTAENLCYYLFVEITTKLLDLHPPLEVNFVRIWESDDAYAEYNGENNEI